jgi:hypothetical protein
MKRILTALVLALSLVYALTACGGGDPAAPTILTDRSEVQGGSAEYGAPTLVAPFIGPEVNLAVDHSATVCINGLWVQKLFWPSSVSWVFELATPKSANKASGLSSLSIPPLEIGWQLCDRVTLPAGKYNLQAKMTMRSSFQGGEGAANSLSTFSSIADWTVTIDN